MSDWFWGVLDFLGIYALIYGAGFWKVRGIPILGWLEIWYERIFYGIPFRELVPPRE